MLELKISTLGVLFIQLTVVIIKLLMFSLLSYPEESQVLTKQEPIKDLKVKLRTQL